MAHNKQEPDKAQPCWSRVEGWEIELADKIAASFKAFPEADDLRADLYRRLLEIKQARPAGVRNWRNFLAKSLWNSANNRLASWNLRRDKFTSLSSKVRAGEDSPVSLEETLPEPEGPAELKLRFGALWHELDPDLRRLWRALEEEGGHLGRTAKRLNKHRNTVYAWVKSLKGALRRHGFPC